jgi:hypothetical protein
VLDGESSYSTWAEGLSVPTEFKHGDEVEVALHPDLFANVQTDTNAGYYEIAHVKSGKKFRVPHKTSHWRFT